MGTVDPVRLTNLLLNNAKKADDGAYIGGMLYAVYTAFSKDGLKEGEAMLKASQLVGVFALTIGRLNTKGDDSGKK